jgi:hypothetical protein
MILQMSDNKFTDWKPSSRSASIARGRTASRPANAEKPIERGAKIPIPLPAAVLLTPQPEPSCEPPDSTADERQKLDYERQCYRHAEMIVRGRLRLLQDSVDETIDALSRSELGR